MTLKVFVRGNLLKMSKPLRYTLMKPVAPRFVDVSPFGHAEPMF